MREPGKVLVLTVGTGNMEKLETSLLAPLAKSIRDGEWKEAVLLPSTVTEDFAAEIARRFPGLPVRVETLPKPDLENDADACFGHFDAVLGGLLKKGYTADSFVADFTRGTKAMSAALVLAAVRRGVPRMRYIWGERDSRGMVRAGTERIAQLRTALATARRRLDIANELMNNGDFAAVLELAPDPDGPFSALIPDPMRGEAAQLRRRARFFAAWDRLNYAEAARGACALRGEDGLDKAAEWARRLSDAPAHSNHAGMARWLRLLVADLIANGERRVKHGQNEDALVRAYRVLELVGQARLFDHGLDSANLDRKHPAVESVGEKARKTGSHPFSETPRGKLQASRFQVGRILRHCEDPLAARLDEFEREPALKPKLRNISILLHGFDAQAPRDSGKIRSLLDQLAGLAREDAGEPFDDWIAAARSVPPT